MLPIGKSVVGPIVCPLPALFAFVGVTLRRVGFGGKFWGGVGRWVWAIWRLTCVSEAVLWYFIVLLRRFGWDRAVVAGFGECFCC